MRIAVVGGGIAGLSAAWLLRRAGRVTLFEADTRVGGHTHTVEVNIDGQSAAVDTGFLVFNHHTYPQLTALFRHLGVETVETDMSLGVSVDEGALEWSGRSLDALFAQPGNLWRPAFWGMLADMLRFNSAATRAACGGGAGRDTLGEFLDSGHYGAPFRDWYLLPMAASIWSCPPRQMLDYPFATFARFCHNHGLLQIAQRPRWRTVLGGGREYVRKLLAELGDVRRGAAVTALRTGSDGLWLHWAGGAACFDRVVLACHSDQSLAILGEEASPEERAVLAAVRYQPNEAWLHTDTALLPQRPAVWSAWNFLAGRGQSGEQPVSVSYLLNRLQPLPFERPLIVSLNPLRPPHPETVLGRYDYAHPVFDHGAIAAQARLPAIQGRRNIWFCGAWTGYGFHEDGLRSALEVAAAFGVRPPWAAASPAPGAPAVAEGVPA